MVYEPYGAPPSTRPAALVTGGSSGIGYAIAEMLLAEEGFDVTLVARRADKLAEAAARVGAHAFAADLSKPEVYADVIAAHAQQFGRLDVLVNSAGIGIASPAQELLPKHLDLLLDINVRGVYRLCQEALPLLRESHGWIVNIASIAGAVPSPGMAAYGATKSALIALTQSLDAELDPYGVRAIAISPASVDIAMAVVSGTPPETKIRPQDLAEVVRMALRLSPRARISSVVIENVARPVDPARTAA